MDKNEGGGKWGWQNYEREVKRIKLQKEHDRAHEHRIILVLLECIWNAPVVLLVLPAFDEANSLGSPPSRVVYPLVSPWVTASRFLAEE